MHFVESSPSYLGTEVSLIMVKLFFTDSHFSVISHHLEVMNFMGPFAQIISKNISLH